METVIDRPLDLQDLLATPEDGNRYEVLDGALVMTPPPETSHQRVMGELFVLLRQAARPLGLQTFVAPVAWRIGPGQVPEPDLLVAAPEAVTERAIVAPPCSWSRCSPPLDETGTCRKATDLCRGLRRLVLARRPSRAQRHHLAARRADVRGACLG